MKNPFSSFKKIAVKSGDRIPLDRYVRKNKQVMDNLLTQYQCLDQDMIQKLCRFLNQPLHHVRESGFHCTNKLPEILHIPMARAGKIYEHSRQLIEHITYTVDDIKNLCTLTGLSKSVKPEQTGLTGLYISALINACDESYFEFDFQGHQQELHFLGFRLESGKKIIVNGNLGCFAGAQLNGGELIVNGTLGSWCAAGMTKGRIKITSDEPSTTDHKRQRWFYGLPVSVQEIVR
ncbi:MAG: hypothetical protein ABFS43_10415 [Thermodesulfobacteriota bacterium]